MTWKDTLQREVLEEFVDAQRLKGTAMTGRDDRRERVKLDPFVPAEAPPAVDVEPRPLQVDSEDEPVEYGDRPVVVEVAPIRKPEKRGRDAGAPRYRPPRPTYARRRP